MERGTQGQAWRKGSGGVTAVPLFSATRRNDAAFSRAKNLLRAHAAAECCGLTLLPVTFVSNLHNTTPLRQYCAADQ